MGVGVVMLCFRGRPALFAARYCHRLNPLWTETEPDDGAYGREYTKEAAPSEAAIQIGVGRRNSDPAAPLA
jgi:hypothetical protein